MSLPFNLNSVLASASLIEGFDVVRNAFPVREGLQRELSHLLRCGV